MEKTILRLCAAASIAITPWTTFDPINPPKFLFLTLIGGICAVQLIIIRKKIKFKKSLQVPLVLILIIPIVSALFTKAIWDRDLYGTYGRLFGLVTSACLALLLCFFASSKAFRASNFFEIFLVVSLISILYGLLQLVGKDFAPWENPYSRIVGFLGNPNFMSSFSGISVILLSYWYINFKENILKAVAAIIFQLAGILLIIQSDSIQGFFVILAGIFSSLLYLAIQKRRKFLDIIIIIFLGIGLILIGLLITHRGPFFGVFTSGTFANRIEYWKTGLRMIQGNWQLGVGPDQFGTWFRYYRPESTIKLLGTEVITDSPHNSIIEFGANFGLFALIAYVWLNILVFSRIVKFARNSKKISIEHLLFSSGFVGYFAQTLISPNQIGLTIWGWVLMGIILNNSYSAFDPQNYIEKRETKAINARRALHPDTDRNLLSIILGSLIGLLLSLPLFFQQIMYRNALVSADAVKLIDVAESWPREEYIQIQIVEILLQNQHWALSKRLSEDILSNFPNSYLGWQKFYENRETTMVEKEFARKELHRLDPLNPNWK